MRRRSAAARAIFTGRPLLGAASHRACAALARSRSCNVVLSLSDEDGDDADADAEEMDAVVLEVTEYLSDAELLFSLEDADDASGAAPESSAGDDVDVASSRQFPALPADAKPPLPPALLLGVARTSSAGSDASAASTTGAASPSACLASDGKVLERMKEAAPAPPPRLRSGALAELRAAPARADSVRRRPPPPSASRAPARPPRRAPLPATARPTRRAAPPAAPPLQTHPPAHPLPATTPPWTTCWRGGTRRRRS